MNKNSADRSAFFTPKFLISFAFCLVGLVLALVAFALYPGGNAFAKQGTRIVPEMAKTQGDLAPTAEVAKQNTVGSVPIFEAFPVRPPDAPIQNLPTVPLQVSGQIDMAALGLHPLPYPAIPKAWQNGGPDSAAAGSTGVHMQTSADFVNQSTNTAFAALSTGWQSGETVAFSLNGGAPTNFSTGSFGSGTPIIYLGITISTGSGFGYITIDAVGNISGRRAGAVVQVAPTGPYLPGAATAPHAENTSGATPQMLMFGTGYPINSSITRYRNGTSLGTTTTSSLGLYFVGMTLSNNGNTSAVYSSDNGTAGSMGGSSEEERSDAGGPQAGDTNTTRAFVDRPVLNSATGGSVAFVGEGFNPGETVNITTCTSGSVTADANGAASFFLNIAPGAGTASCVLTGASSAKVGRASVLSHANATNRRAMIVAPSSGNNSGTITVLATKLPAGDTAAVYLDGVQVGTATSNSAGNASLVITKPSTPVGAHEIGYINNSGTGDAQASVYLLTTAGPTPTPGTPSPTPTASPLGTATPTAPPTVCSFVEGMDDITNLPAPKGWVEQNNSTLPAGTTNWFQGNTAVFSAQCGNGDSYIGANFNNTGGTTGAEVISNWLLTPPITLQNGGTLSFWTRTVAAPAFPDRLQVRMSTNGSSSNVGGTPTSTGDFTTLLLDINPTYQTTAAGAYPNNWQQFNISLSGIGIPIKGRLAFRYFVESAGPAGVNSDFIGIDSVSYTCSGATPTPGCGTPTATPPPTPSPTPIAVGCQVLLDQTDTPAANATSSQDFETANDAFDNQTADDFVVPAGGWNIMQVNASGAYFNGTGPMPFVNLYFYSDSGGFPGGSVGTYLNVVPSADASGSIIIIVPGGGLSLAAGTYWVSVQARMDFATGGQWGWTDRVTTSHNAAAWQNPGGGFAAGCLTWGRRGATCGIDSANPDQIFLFRGCTSGTPAPVLISGKVFHCASPAPTPTPSPGGTATPAPTPPVANVLMTLSGSSSGTTLTDASGNYSFSVAAGGSYTVTASKPALPTGTGSINNPDVQRVNLHFLGVTIQPPGCRLQACDANINGLINVQDVTAVNRFFLGFTSGLASVGQYKYTPASRTYPSIAANQTGQDYAMYVVGDPAPTFVTRPESSSVTSVSLPQITAESSREFAAPVTTSNVDADSDMIGFQADISFDERSVTFAPDPVQPAGLTGSNWTVAGNVLPGAGPIRTLRVSAYSNNAAPLNGKGTLFELKIAQGSAGGTALTWGQGPSTFLYVDGSLNMLSPGSAVDGVINPPSKR